MGGRRTGALYITVYANAGHTYMYVDGILYDTAGQAACTPHAGWSARPTTAATPSGIGPGCNGLRAADVTFERLMYLAGGGHR